MWGHRVVIPEKCRDRVLKLLHEPHMGIVKPKALARSYAWWPDIDEAVEQMCRACEVCASQADAPPRQAPVPWAWPARPWTRLHLDFLGPIFGKLYLVVIDATSKWLEIFNVPSTAASSTIERLNELWSRWGLPRQIVSDNGPPFTSQEFKVFLNRNGIEHIFTAPYHPSSNGAAENAVKTLKRVIKKANFEKVNVTRALNTFLLYYRNTQHISTGESPAMLMLGRGLRTRLDALKPDRERRMRQVQQRQVDDAGGASRKFEKGEAVWYRQYLKGDKWLPGTVGESLGPSNLQVIGDGGNPVHRHVDQLKRRSRSSLVLPCPESDVPRLPVANVIQESNVETVEHNDVSSEPQTEESDAGEGLTSESEPCEPYQNEPTLPRRPVRQCRLKGQKYKF
ncbi:hypothetical protein K1T71_015314 [Dendrolimus kikuchii]|nr:hypothetical protein K1T71_015314 [Dendrolimus kikuchii]